MDTSQSPFADELGSPVCSLLAAGSHCRPTYMIKLCLHSTACNTECESGSAPFFKLEGPLLCEGPRSNLVGCLCERSWELGDATGDSLECHERVVVRFVDWDGNSHGDCGPFDGLSLRGNTCYVGDCTLAYYVDQQNCWRRQSDGTDWPRLLILPAALA
jgi:hypothetical protein